MRKRILQGRFSRKRILRVYYKLAEPPGRSRETRRFNKRPTKAPFSLSKERRDVPSRRVGCGTHPTSCSFTPQLPNSKTPGSERSPRSDGRGRREPRKTPIPRGLSLAPFLPDTRPSYAPPGFIRPSQFGGILLAS